MIRKDILATCDCQSRHAGATVGRSAHSIQPSGGDIAVLPLPYPGMKFAPEYVSCVIEENFEDARRRCLSPLLAIHYAHVVMLAGRRIVTAEDARGLGQPGDRAVGLLVIAFTTKRVLTSGVWSLPRFKT